MMDGYIERIRTAGLDAALAEIVRLQEVIATDRKATETASGRRRYQVAFDAWVAAGRPTFGGY